MPAPLRQALLWINGRGWLVLFLATLFWGLNVAAGRWAVDQVTPMTIAVFRWGIVSLVLLPIVKDRLRRDAPVLARRPLFLLLMGFFGFTGFTATFYLAAHHTSGVNMAILQGFVPVIVMVGGIIVYRLKIRPLQWMGLAMSLLGVLVIATHGDWRDLLHLAFNRGDAWMFLGSLCYAGYTLGLRSRPAADPLSLFTVFSIVATITSLPLLMLEIVQGRFFMPTLPGYLILLFVAICPSFLGQMLFMRGVELVGPARASLFYNMVPVLGALSAVALVGEPFGLYHALALALVVGGIMVAERVKPA